MAEDTNKTTGKAQTKADQKPPVQTPEEREAARREAMSQQERDAEDLANVDAELAAENAARGTGTIHAEAVGSAAARRRILVARMKAEAEAVRAEQATEEVVVAHGRTIYLSADQTEPFTGGATIKVTPAEAVQLRQAGHLVSPQGEVEQPVGPQVYREAGLLVGHAKGQGQPASK
jgi:hypothetical protein